MPEDPMPITATLLFDKSYEESQSAECISFPVKRSMPGILGHFQWLQCGREYVNGSNLEVNCECATYFKIPAAFIKIWQ